MNITAEQIIAELIVEIYKRDAAIKELKIRNQELREKNELLEEKHWNECMMISQYDEELKKANGMATLYDYVRMCKALDENGACKNMSIEYIDEVNALVLKWCAEHPEQPESVSEQPKGQEKPKKTYKAEFLEKFPNASLDVNGNPHACAHHIYGNKKCNKFDTCGECWNEVMPDETD